MKSIFASKTIWFNALALVGTSLGWIAGNLSVAPHVVFFLVLFQSIVNLVLRLTTKTEVKLALPKE